ncbi:hypothetical protein TNCV_3385971 [Trichonephila clavipes]|nr:hypothetical protein TNCV_3385971 [Trichonephila clavipes]
MLSPTPNITKGVSQAVGPPGDAGDSGVYVTPLVLFRSIMEAITIETRNLNHNQVMRTTSKIAVQTSKLLQEIDFELP